MHGSIARNSFNRRNVSSPVSLGMCISKSTRCDRLAMDDLQSLLAVACQKRTKALRLEYNPKRLPETGVVVGDQE